MPLQFAETLAFRWPEAPWTWTPRSRKYLSRPSCKMDWPEDSMRLLKLLTSKWLLVVQYADDGYISASKYLRQHHPSPPSQWWLHTICSSKVFLHLTIMSWSHYGLLPSVNIYHSWHLKIKIVLLYGDLEPTCDFRILVVQLSFLIHVLERHYNDVSSFSVMAWKENNNK